MHCSAESTCMSRANICHILACKPMCHTLPSHYTLIRCVRRAFWHHLKLILCSHADAAWCLSLCVSKQKHAHELCRQVCLSRAVCIRAANNAHASPTNHVWAASNIACIQAASKSCVCRMQQQERSSDSSRRRVHAFEVAWRHPSLCAARCDSRSCGRSWGRTWGMGTSHATCHMPPPRKGAKRS